MEHVSEDSSPIEAYRVIRVTLDISVGSVLN
ncbi:hypothetical protein [Akkermansia phage Chantilly]|nr:hypothetical protein [Akkermansia phage Chantilly]